MLHVVGLPSAKDTYKPAPFVPAGARATDLLAVNDMLYTSTTGKCGGSADAVYAMDLASEAKPVVSYKTTGSPVGAVALTTDGTVVAVVTNGVVTLDPKTLAVKQSFTDSATTFATGPLVFTHGGKDVIAAGSKDGRILLFDATLSAPIASVKVASDAGATFGADALAFFQQYLRSSARRGCRAGSGTTARRRPRLRRRRASSPHGSRAAMAARDDRQRDRRVQDRRRREAGTDSGLDVASTDSAGRTARREQCGVRRLVRQARRHRPAQAPRRCFTRSTR